MANEVRLIDANAIDYENIMCSQSQLHWLNAIIEQQPTIDLRPKGRWQYYSTTMQECSNCNRHTARHKFKYCPHCGAVMEDKYYE